MGKKLANKMLLIGWDAADWKVIHPLLDAGEMPALEKLINNGVMGNLATLEPPFSPMLWSSIATGMRPDKHGILGFTEPDPSGGGVRPVSGTSRKVKAVWNILMQNNFKTNVIGWWPSHPAEPLNGVCISNFYQRANSPIEIPWKMLPGTVYPSKLAKTFSDLRVHPDELTAAHILPFIPNAEKIDQNKDKSIGMLSKIIADCSSIHSAATWTMENTEWDFMAVYYDAIDHFGHGFMKFHPPKLPGVPDESYENYKEVIVSGYKYHDMMLDRLMKLAGNDTTIMLISDHGFHSDHLRPLTLPKEPAAPAFEHRPYGIFAMMGPNIKKDERIYGATLLDIAPTILTMHGLPYGEDMDGKPLVQSFIEPVLPEQIPSWEDIKGEDGTHPKGIKEDPYAAKEAMDQLIELGYIEDPGENKQEAVKRTIIESEYNLSRVYTGSNRHALAIPILERLYKENPDEIRFAQRLATCYQQENRINDCKNIIKKIKVLLEKNAEKNKQERLKKLEEDESIKQEEKEKIKQNINNKVKKEFPGILLLEGTIFLSENKSKKALELFKKAEKVAPNLPNLYLHLGRAYSQVKQYDDAERAFNKALNIDGDNAQAHYGLGVALLRKEKYLEAVDSLLSTISLIYHFPFAHYHLGEALISLKEYEHAAEAFEVCLTMAPNISKARNWLIKIYEEFLSSPEKAKAVAERPIIKQQNVKNNTAIENVETEEEILSEKATAHRTALKEKSEGEIIIVSGLPRSGTSMMMQILDRGGVPIFTDKLRKADESNPKGYYEHEAVKGLARDNSWLKEAKGKAVKVIAQLLFKLPARYNYKIIFMQRDIQEIVISQQKMLQKNGKRKVDEKNYPLGLELAFKNTLDKVKVWNNRNYNVEVLFMLYPAVLEDTANKVKEINKFLGMDLDENAMEMAVDASLYRNKIPV